MKQNPCRYCALAVVHNGRHYPKWSDECMDCKNLTEHKKYLKAHRKFVEGEPITDLNELLQQEWVMWYHRLKHIEVIKHTQLSTVLGWLEIGAFSKAIRKECGARNET